VTAFIAICTLLLACAVGVLAWPLWRKRPDEPGSRRAGTAALVAALLPVAAFTVYFQASNWDWHAPAEQPALSGSDIQRAVTELQAQLEKKPDDVEAWKLLGRSATVMGDFPLARKAFGEAYTRTAGRDAEAVVGYAESAVLIDETQIDGEAGALFEKAVALAPDNPRALWYAGIVAYRRGDMTLAQQRWVELQQHDLPQDLRQVLAERLAELERTAGMPASKGAGTQDAGAIRLTVDLAPALAGRVSPNATLFLIARRSSGGPVPPPPPPPGRPAGRRAASRRRRMAGRREPFGCGRHAAGHPSRGRRPGHSRRAHFRERATARRERRPLWRGRL
jgi:cytochrome c-type biogenesis protein CcmH